MPKLAELRRNCDSRRFILDLFAELTTGRVVPPLNDRS